MVLDRTTHRGGRVRRVEQRLGDLSLTRHRQPYDLGVFKSAMGSVTRSAHHEVRQCPPLDLRCTFQKLVDLHRKTRLQPRSGILFLHNPIVRHLAVKTKAAVAHFFRNGLCLIGTPANALPLAALNSGCVRARGSYRSRGAPS